MAKSQKKGNEQRKPLVIQGTWNGREVTYRADRINVKMRLTTDQNKATLQPDQQPDVEALARKTVEKLPGVKIVRVSKNSGRVVLEVTKPDLILSTIKELEQNPNVLYAEPDFLDQPHLIPNDDRYDEQWALPMVNAEDAWDMTTGSATGVLIGIVDTGIAMDTAGALNHPELDDTSRYLYGTDFIGDDSVPRDIDGHGTHVAGIAGAESGNSDGIAGMNWHTPLYITRTLGTGGGSHADLADAIEEIVDYAVAHSLRVVINYSGGGSDSNTKRDACQYLDDHDMVLCASTGNDDAAPVSSPALYSTTFDGVIAVGASDSADDVASFSNVGPEVTVVAPGVGILSTFPTYTVSQDTALDYVSWDGTSMASPLVAGLVSLMWSVNPNLTNREIKDILTSTAVKLSTGVDFSNDWGFGRIDAAAAVRRAHLIITQQTFSLNYIDVPEREERGLAIRFDVQHTRAVDFEITTPLGSPFRIVNSTVHLPESSNFNQIDEVYLWITYTGTTVDDTASASVTVRSPQWFETWTIPLTANTIQRPSAAIMLCLDRSSSMLDPSGVGSAKRIDVLHYSANILMDVVQEGNGVGIVAFDQDPHDVKVPLVGPLGAPGSAFDTLRGDLRTAISTFVPNPSGLTAIGDGVERAQLRLSTVSGYENKAVLVLTDGQETASKYINDVHDQINDRVYAVGMGKAENISPNALTALTNNTGGYTLLTGDLNNDSYFKLAKYFLQILAGVTNEDIVVDPDGRILPGQVIRIPFQLTECDLSSDIILMAPGNGLIRLSLETPSGKIILPADVVSLPGVLHQVSPYVNFYRLSLPVAINGGERSGRWYAILEIDKKDFGKPVYSTYNQNPSEEYRQMLVHGVPFTLLVHAYSNLRMRASLSQNSHEPGAQLTLKASLREYDMPVSKGASVRAITTRPDGTIQHLVFGEEAPGTFAANLVTSQSGVYSFRIIAKGKTSRGVDFTREQVLTGTVWKGGDQKPPKTETNTTQEAICSLMNCILSGLSPEYRKRLSEQGVNIDHIEKCLKAKCKETSVRQSRANPEIAKMIRELSSLVNLEE